MAASKVISVRLTDEEQVLLEKLVYYVEQHATRGLNLEIKVSQADVIRFAIRELSDQMGQGERK